MPQYGDRTYWNVRYGATRGSPFDWLCDWSQLEPTVSPLVDRGGLVLIIGCGDAPFSPDIYYDGGYKRTIHIDYSEVAIERQREMYPEMDFRVMDALNMRFRDCTFDAVIDKSLIDTTMCYPNGHEATKKLFSEIERVLKPGGRLITVSLHSEDEVIRYRFSPAVSHCRVANTRRDRNDQEKSQFHAFAVFDKLRDTTIDERIRILDQHPIDIVNAIRDDETQGQVIPRDRPQRDDKAGPRWHLLDRYLDDSQSIEQLMSTVDVVLRDLMDLHDRARALAERQRQGGGDSPNTLARGLDVIHEESRGQGLLVEATEEQDSPSGETRPHSLQGQENEVQNSLDKEARGQDSLDQ